ncbi:MAG: carbohydrate ABC transporter permease [Chloroflexi bacterium]|nr:MAG: carbohydrate ABC transporter permease [Chloroflexota bacterium]
MRKYLWVRQILGQIFLIIIGLYVIVPIWGMLRLAFDGSLLSRPTEFRFFPKVFSLEPLFSVLDRPYQSVHFTTLLKNSLVVSLGAALLALVLGASLAYAFARFRFPGRKPGLFILLLTAVIPPIAFATPLYIVLSILQIRTSLLGLTIVYAVFAIPFCIWNMRAAFQSVPRELEEAAFLDGAGYLSTFRYVTLPLALPSIAIAALISFLMAYSEFAIGWLFVDKAQTVTLSMAIYAMVQSGNAQPWSILGSLVVIMSIPVILVFVIFQRTLLERMLFGALDS